MRIGINGRFLVAKQTGVQRMAYNLVLALITYGAEHEFILFTGEDEASRKEWQRSNVTVVTSPIREGDTLGNIIWEQIKLPFLAKTYKIDVLHSPANMAPLFYKGASMIHIHDLCFVVNPQWYNFYFRTWYNFVIPRLARKANLVITNSNNSCNDLLQFCKLDASKVRLVYWAVDKNFLEENKQTPAPVSTPYILYVGSLEPRKNIKTLVQAFEKLRFAHPDLKVKLILIGGESPLFADIGLTIKDFKEDIVLKGFVDDESLRAYYQHASLLAYPSLYEGFGLPPLEAMAHGLPVVTSQTSSLPEVVGEAAIMIDPLNTQQLADEMARVLLDPALQQELRQKGWQQVRKFNWARVARNILCIYHELSPSTLETKKSRPSYIPFEKWKILKKTIA